MSFLTFLRVASLFAIAVLAAPEAHGQSAQPPQVRAAQECAEGQRLFEQKNDAASEARFLAGIEESEKNANATKIRGGCLVQLAQLQAKQKRYVEAEASARRAVAIFERLPFQANLGLSTALTVLSRALEDEGKYSEAIAAVERTWKLELGDRSDQAAQYRGVPFRKHLGRLYLQNKQYDLAIPLLQENVSLLEKPGITGHTEVVPALNDLAAAYIATGELSNAETRLNRALSLSDKWPEEVTTDVLLNTLDQCERVMRLSGHITKAKAFGDRAAAIRSKYAAPGRSQKD